MQEKEFKIQAQLIHIRSTFEWFSLLNDSNTGYEYDLIHLPFNKEEPTKVMAQHLEINPQEIKLHLIENWKAELVEQYHWFDPFWRDLEKKLPNMANTNTNIQTIKSNLKIKNQLFKNHLIQALTTLIGKEGQVFKVVAQQENLQHSLNTHFLSSTNYLIELENQHFVLTFGLNQ